LVVKRSWLFWTIAANLLVLVGLAFAYPHLMVAPGPLAAGHAGLATDCFACHTPWRGTTAQKCIDCHALSDIGLRTTRGVSLPQHGIKTSFHQQLSEQNCMACHSDHAGPMLTRRNRRPFSHALLKPEVRQDCATCHTKPTNEMHRTLTVGCAQCHKAEAWKPATFDHAKFFELDKDHNASCITCHTGNDTSRYTCYGCHEHTPSNIRRKHEEEGISDLENCVRCHRSARGERDGGGREGGKQREGRKRD
jgi:hypothetical protein